MLGKGRIMENKKLTKPEKPPIQLEENLKKALTELTLLFLLSQKECYIGELTEIMRRRSHDMLTIVFPYAAIYRLQQSGYIIEKEKRHSPDGRRRQYFQITDSGRNYLDKLLDTYHRFIAGFSEVLQEEVEKDE